MKNSNKSFDAELIKRLRDYSEEPRIELWQKIAASTEANRRPLTTRRPWWILVLGVIAIGGLYYFEKTNTNTGQSPVVSKTLPLSESLPLKDKAGSGTVSSEKTTAQHTGVGTVGNTSTQSTGNNTIAGNDISLNQERFPTTNELSSETSADEANFDEGPVDNVPIQGNEIENTVNGGTEKVVEAKLAVKAVKDDEGKTVIKEKEKKQSKFSIYFTIMPTFGYQRINSNSSDDIIIESVKRISTFSTDRLGVRAELGVEDPLTQRIKVFGGLVYYQRKQTINYTQKQVEYTEVSEGPDGQIIVVPQFTYVEKSFEYELKNLGVQVGVSYELARKKLLQTLGTGFEFHMALNKLESSPATPEFTNNPSAYVFYNLYYRLQYPAEGRLRAVFQPTLNYSFYINQNLNAPFYVKPYGLGLNLGFTYNF
jgi:hypothetical protein